MRLLLLTLLLPCAAQVELRPCDPADASQLWQLGANSRVASASAASACLATAQCAPISTSGVAMSACDSTACNPAGTNLQWVLDGSGRLASTASGGELCLTLAAVSGPQVNLWPCAGASANGEWTFSPAGGGYGTLATRYPGGGCLSAGGGAVVLNASALGRRLYGVGGLAAIGGARLIHDYVEPQRGTILDLLFNATGGTAMQILKIEMEGDIDSSYGSGPSFQHSRGEALAFNRGIYLPWLLGEAKRRNPGIPTYSLAWGLPAWVGNGSYLTPESVDYHLAYYKGVRQTYNHTFPLAGIHNERSWSRAWVKALRAALDGAGFNATLLAVGDGSNSQCADCSGFPDDSITTAAARDPAFAAAFDYIGLHSAGPLPTQQWDWQTARKEYIQSEANDVDGPLIETADGSFPQWAGNAGSPQGPGLEWPQHFLLNYVNARVTGTIICPLSHAWTWNYGRHNHGTGLFIRPWDGHYVLGAAFWTQAHFTQATRPGWFWLDGSATGVAGGATYGALVAPDLSAFSIVAVNVDPAAPAALNFTLVGALAASFAGSPLATWVSNATTLFTQVADTPTDGASGRFAFTLAPRSVATLTTLRTLAHVEPPVPPRAPFPLPYTNDFEAQAEGQPGRMLSDLFGAFYVAPDPLGQRGSVLKQAMPASPASNAWLRRDGIPFTSLPTPGAAFANGNVSASFLLAAGDAPAGGGAAGAAVCGRVPIWQPADFAPPSGAPGVCLWAFSNGTWAVVEWLLGAEGGVVVARGALAGGSPVGAWHSLALAFTEDACAAYVDGAQVGGGRGLVSTSGAYGLATLFHAAYFDGVALAAATGRPQAGGYPAGATSWLLDALPGNALVSNFSGWVGFALDLTFARAPLAVAGVGRFRAPGNAGAHALDIIDAATGRSALAAPLTVRMDDAGCGSPDVLGFCYAAAGGGGGGAQPAQLAAGRVYYVVSQEAAGGDAFVSMSDAAAATTHVHRDGTTLLSYRGPGMGVVTGRVWGATRDALQASSEIEIMNGPLNLLLA